MLQVLGTYFARLDAGDAPGCADLFAPDALCVRQALGPDGSLRAGVDVLRGRDAIHDYVSARGVRPYRHEIRSEIPGGGQLCVEGVVRDDAGAGTSLFLVTAQLDAAGLMTRYLAIGTAVAVADLEGIGIPGTVGPA